MSFDQCRLSIRLDAVTYFRPRLHGTQQNFVRINFCTDTNLCHIGSPFTWYRDQFLQSLFDRVRICSDIARALLGRYSGPCLNLFSLGF